MPRSPQQLRSDAQRIWQAGIDAVQPARLIPQVVAVEAGSLWIDTLEFPLATIDRIVVVGAGKAGAAMTVALEQVLGGALLAEKRVTGWVNVPADCVVPTARVKLHPARPAGVNEPRPEGVVGTQAIVRLVGELGPRDLCLCLLAGGGSALLPAPLEGFPLEAKIALSRAIAARGATIEQLNTVRRELSTIKGGGLAAACRAGNLVALVLSDVLGDDLEMIASGPTLVRTPTPALAVRVLEELELTQHPAAQAAIALLAQRPAQPVRQSHAAVHHVILGNNATAVDGAGVEAERLGYSHAMISATSSEGAAERVAEHLVEMAQRMRAQEGPDCLIMGGETTVTLAARPGRGGRNQQLALAALALDDWHDLALLSGGTDGEDGPTDAAGALIDQQVAARAKSMDLSDALARNDAYPCLDRLGALVKTGPTGTNVCDLRVLTVSR